MQVLSSTVKTTPPITPKISQRMNRHNKSRLGYTRRFSTDDLCDPRGPNFRMSEKGGLSLRGIAFMTVLAVLTASAVLESTLPTFRSSYKMQDKGATMMV